MEYRTKVIVLSCAAAALALAYALGVAFDPARRGARADAYAWLDPRDADRIYSIAISAAGGADPVVLLRAPGGGWVVAGEGGARYPARQARVGDFVAELSRRAPFPVRATSAAAHERLSLGEADAARVTAAGAAGPPLLDLLIGRQSGRNAYMRRAGRGEVRSGEDRFSHYVQAGRGSWYNLMFFPENDGGLFSIQDVARVSAYPPGGAAPMVFTRSGRAWAAGFEIAALNSLRVDAFVRDIMLSSGESFASGEGAAFGDSRLALEFADGTSAEISFTAPDENGRRLASVSGGLAYVVTGWMHDRLFPPPETFGL